MLQRKAYEHLVKWKNTPDKKALLITGARQIGKTYIIRKFAEENYSNFIEINFITNPDAAKIFNGDLNAETILINLTAYTQKPLVKGDTLIFFDEIQECPSARTAIKFLVDDGQFDYIESGSLLGVRYKEVKSYPVGYEENYRMYPLDFEEFATANGIQPQTIEYLKKCYNNKETVTEAVHQSMLKLFQYYIIVGGMPAVVQKFVDTKDIGEVLKIQKDILDLYRQDISKYSDSNKEKIKSIFDLIPAQLNDRNRRFTLSDIKNSARMLGNIQFDILSGDLSVNMGSILENVFAQELVSNGFLLRYFNKKNIGEIDFIVQKGKSAVPIEIKSGNDYTKHKALDNLIAKQGWNINSGIVFCKGNLEIENGITYYPWYMSMLFKQETLPEHLKVNVDIVNI